MMEQTHRLAATIRPMQAADIPQVHAVDQLSFSLPWPERSYRYELTENPVSRQWVVELPGADGQKLVAGMAVVWLILDELHIGTFAIHPDFRRLGLGRQLLAILLLEATKEGARRVYLEVRRSNTSAQKLYKSFGFYVSGVRTGYYKNNGEDALLMDLDELDAEKLNRLLDGAPPAENNSSLGPSENP